jgi:BlaI family transcriptional regulator, penicillinase repressor
MNQHRHLSRRERQIMDVVYELGSATAAEVRQKIPDPPSYSAVRAMLRVLEQKGIVKHEQDGPRYIYRPIVRREMARRSALSQMVRTFFEGSTAQAVAALLDHSKLSKADLDRLSQMIEAAKKQGR